MRWSIPRARILTLALLLASGIPVTVAADELLYQVEGGRLVFTNTPSRADARPVPGFYGRSLPAPSAASLPETAYDPFIDEVARENGLSAALIKAVALVESGFNAKAVSPKGAQGLMQLMPGTAARYNVNDAFDPLENLRAGAAHLRDLLDEFGGDLTLALAAYNAGSAAVRRYGGVPNYRETKSYVDKVQRRMGRTAALPASSSTPVKLTPVKLRRAEDGSVLLVN